MQNRSISLPIRKITEPDAEGFVKEMWEYMRGIRASFKSASRQDEILANQCGYEATVIVEIAACAYNGASFFVDEATGDDSAYWRKETAWQTLVWKALMDY